jgi:hypothetical protein
MIATGKRIAIDVLTKTVIVDVDISGDGRITAVRPITAEPRRRRHIEAVGKSTDAGRLIEEQFLNTLAMLALLQGLLAVERQAMPRPDRKFDQFGEVRHD